MSVYLFGNGGLGREVLNWMLMENHPLAKEVKGFVVEDAFYKDFTFFNFSTVPFSKLKETSENIKIIVCVGDAKIRRRLYQTVEGAGFQVVGFQSSNALISPDCKIGKGVIINPNSRISPNVVIGDGTLINCGCGIGHDSTIGEFVTFFGNAAVNGDVRVGNDATVGCGVIVHPGVSIGNGATLGIGSIVIRNVMAAQTVFGNPAKRLIV